MAHERTGRALEAPFEITKWDEITYDEPREGPKLTRVHIQKRYRGAIDGLGVADVLTAQGVNGAGYVASERIDGTLDGRRGTFVIQQGGVAEGTEQSSYGTIVPASGTGELAGIAGQANEAQREVLSLNYTL